MNIYFKKLSDPLFNNFQRTLFHLVSDNSGAWNIPAGKVTELGEGKSEYDALYAAITNKKMRNSEQVQVHREGREVYERFIELFSKEYIVNNSLISAAQKVTMGFNVRKNSRSPRPQLTDVVTGALEALPGSQVKVVCLAASGRPAVHKDADCAEIRYSIGAMPATVDDCPLVEISSKAVFTMLLSPAHQGKPIFAFLRWRNNSNLTKSGPWCNMVTTVVRS